MKNIKPSELIELALHDLEVVESKPEEYVVKMNTWHTPALDKCEVCFAGAVMAVSLKCGKKPYIPNDFPEAKKFLTALDQFRSGHVMGGLNAMGIYYSAIRPYKYVSSYEESPADFKEDMRKLALDLRKRGL
jgi:hypothetical protein